MIPYVLAISIFLHSSFSFLFSTINAYNFFVIPHSSISLKPFPPSFLPDRICSYNPFHLSRPFFLFFSLSLSLSLSFSFSLSLTGSWDGTVKLWDVYKNDCIETMEHGCDVLAVAFRPDGKEICAAATNGNLHIWDVEVCFLLYCFPTLFSFLISL